MNTIISIRQNLYFKNTPQTTKPKSLQRPAFKGTLGKKVVQKIVNKEAITVTGVLAMLTGLIGLNKDKVIDVIGELINKIKSLQNENENLKKELGDVSILATRKEQDAMIEFAKETQRLRDNFSLDLQQKNTEIAQKDAKIAELQKYETMAKVKSIDELDIITPKQFIAVLDEAIEAMPKAKESAVNYLFTGEGQEEFLAQIERSNKILKARKEGITQLPEIATLYKERKTYIGFEPVFVAQEIIKQGLIENENGAKINHPKIRAQVLENMNAITKHMSTTEDLYAFNDKILIEVSEIHRNLYDNQKELLNDGWVFAEKKVSQDNGKIYYSFKRDSEKFDIYLTDLAYRDFGFARITKADGTTLTCANENYWK